MQRTRGSQAPIRRLVVVGFRGAAGFGISLGMGGSVFERRRTIERRS